MGFWDQFDDEEEGEDTGAEGAEAAPDDDSEEDAAFRDAMEMADAVKGGWGAREQLEACLAVAEAALLSKAAKAQRREQAEEERRREASDRAMAAQREREEREAREIVAAREREALRVRREREARQAAMPAAPTGPSAEELRRRERERQVAAEERAAKVRLANAQAAEIEAKAELMRAQARAAAEGRARPTAPAARVAQPLGRIAAGPLAVSQRVAVVRGASATRPRRVVEAASVATLAAPVEVVAKPRAVVTTPAWTGADLARLRADRQLSQRELAALMGVGHGMVAKAEVAPGKPLGDGMAAAFTRVALRGSATVIPGGSGAQIWGRSSLVDPRSPGARGHDSPTRGIGRGATADLDMAVGGVHGRQRDQRRQGCEHCLASGSPARSPAVMSGHHLEDSPCLTPTTPESPRSSTTSRSTPTSRTGAP